MVTNGFKLTIKSEAEQGYVLESLAYAVRPTACVANAKAPLFSLLLLFFPSVHFCSPFSLYALHYLLPPLPLFFKLFLTTRA